MFTKQNIYDNQRKIWGMLRKNKLDVENTTHTNKITSEGWKTYFEDFLRIKEGMDEKHPEIEEQRDFNASDETMENLLE